MWFWLIPALAVLAFVAQALQARRAAPGAGPRADAAFWIGLAAWVAWGLWFPSARLRFLLFAAPVPWLALAGLLAPATLRWLKHEQGRFLGEEEPPSGARGARRAGEPPLLDEADRRLHRRLADLMGRRASEIMVPLERAVCAGEHETPAEVIARMHARGVSRLAICDAARGEVKGVLVDKDLVALLPVAQEPGDAIAPDLAGLRRAVPSVGLGRPVAEVLAALREQGGGVAAVRDSRGRLAGFISWDEVFRALVGRES